MTKTLKRLSDAELEIMLVVWDCEEAVSASFILDKIQGKRSWALPTLMTVLSRLVKKQFLAIEKRGRNNFYYATIEASDYKESEGKSVLEKLYGNSFKNFVTSLYNSKAINEQDLEELRDFINDTSKED